MSKTPQMLTPVKLGDLELKNRVAMAPMTRGRCDEETEIPTDFMATYYEQRASAGLIITEGTVVSKQAQGWPGAPGIYNDEQVEGWKKVVDAVHAKGGKIFCQLWHQGRVTHSSIHGLHPISASAIACAHGEAHLKGLKTAPYEVPRAATDEDIKGIIADFKLAAANAKKAGFDGIELHGANGYILDQFMQSCTNVREDAYGGSFENRFRIVGECLAAALESWPANRVGIRLSPNGAFNAMGSEDNFEMFQYVLRQLNAMKIGYVHVLDGLAFGFHQKCKPFKLFDAKSQFDGFIIGNCGYTPEVAEGAVGSGAADMIAFGRPYISNPDLVERMANNWPLAPSPAWDTWYRQAGDDQTKNLIEFPAYQPEAAGGSASASASQ